MAPGIAPAGRHRLAHGLTAVLLAVGATAGVATVGAAPSYAATPGNVCQPGAKLITWSTVKKPWVVDHAKEYSNNTSEPLTHYWATTTKEVISASGKVDAGVSVSENTLIESLQAHVRLKLAAAGSRTVTTTEKFRLTLGPQTTDIVFDAAHLVQADYTHWICKVGGYQKNGHGTAHSWYITDNGAVNCPGSQDYKRPPAGSAGRAAQVFC